MVAIRHITNPKPAMDSHISNSLSRLHEFSQLQVDRNIDFLASDQFRRLEAAEQLRFRGALVDVTALLGGFTAAVLKVKASSLESYLVELFDCLAILEAVSKEVGAPVAPGAYVMYRKLCLRESSIDGIGTVDIRLA